MKEKPLVNGDYLLQKFPGKGGWTYAQLPEVLPDKNAHFGWVKVRGTIDSYEFRNFHLMPMGNGMLFFSVNATIRKAICKAEGDTVHIMLYREDPPSGMDDDFEICLADEPSAREYFFSLPETEQKKYREWILTSRTESEKTDRIAETINRLSERTKKH